MDVAAGHLQLSLPRFVAGLGDSRNVLASRYFNRRRRIPDKAAVDINICAVRNGSYVQFWAVKRFSLTH